MFDTYVAGTSDRVGRRTKSVVLVSIIVHVLVVAALVFSSSWVIHKLSVPRTETVFQAAGLQAPPPPPPGGEKKSSSDKKKSTKKPTKSAQATNETTEVAEDDGDADGEVGGDPNGVPGGTGLPGGIPGGLGIEGLGDALGDPPKPQKTKVVPANVVKGLRISGDEQIRPPDQAAVAMQRAGKSRVVATAKLCLAQSGRVKSVSMIKTSGFPAWDRKIRQRMKTWRYRPYRVGSKAIPVCTAVTFVYAP